ncbi:MULTISPECIES: ATP-binding protein [Streptomycetaceae]|nr:ATP-binding protein [Streptantibioticus cattleyicolor]
MHSATPFEGGLVAGAETDSVGRRPGERDRRTAKRAERTDVAGTQGAARKGAIPSPRHNRRTQEIKHHLRHADLPAVAEVRRLLREQLGRWGVPTLIDTAELLTSEIVTNALVHTGHGAILTATLTSDADHRLRVEVRDFTAHRPAVRHPSEQSSSGRGLLLVEALADTWGVRPQDAGKTVWFELTAEAV